MQRLLAGSLIMQRVDLSMLCHPAMHIEQVSENDVIGIVGAKYRNHYAQIIMVGISGIAIPFESQVGVVKCVHDDDLHPAFHQMKDLFVDLHLFRGISFCGCFKLSCLHLSLPAYPVCPFDFLTNYLAGVSHKTFKMVNSILLPSNTITIMPSRRMVKISSMRGCR